jgi:hypothetical protein
MSEDSPLNHVPVDNGLASLSLSEEEEKRNRKTIREEADRNCKTNEMPEDTTHKTNSVNTEISYECYSSELQMPDIMRLIQARIFTFTICTVSDSAILDPDHRIQNQAYFDR